EETLNIVVTMGKDIACSDQCSLIIQNKKGEFVVKAGIPKDKHRIGYRINHEYSTLREMLERGDGLISVKDMTFPSELRNAIGLDQSHAKSILYMPLHYKGEPIGLIIFSYIYGDQGRFNIDILQKIKIMGMLAATAIGSAYERKRREKEIARKERLAILGENSASVAHIIRNSLTCIGGFANRLNGKLYSNDIFNGNLEKVREYSEIILKEIQKLEKIAGDVLRYTRLASQKLDLDSCSINTYISEFIVKYSSKFPDLHIGFYPDSHDVTLCIDKEAIETCLENLLRNAVEARATNIFIKTKLKSKDRKLSISIINDGDRICPTIINKIFDPFMTTKPDGTGLGLANTQAIIAAHNGEITVVSDEHKTEFKILLPIIRKEN
ncbi:MAG: ATP-binding protein, partial [Thermodesulfovibrionales bacterium]